jgi:hypothetical protein
MHTIVLVFLAKRVSAIVPSRDSSVARVSW